MAEFGSRVNKTLVLDTLVTEMIATDNQPFTFVSGIGLRRLVAAMEPRYNLKTEKHYCTDILDGIVANDEKKIKALIAEDAGPFLSFTTDCWSGDIEALMSLTCHFIDDNRERKQVILNAKAMSGSHTGEYISNTSACWSTGTSATTGLYLCSVSLVLTWLKASYLQNMDINGYKIPDLSCRAHTIQLVVTDGINSQRVVLDVMPS